MLEKFDILEKIASEFSVLQKSKQDHLCISVVTIGFHCMWYSHPSLKDTFKLHELLYPTMFSLTSSGYPIAIGEYLYNIARHDQIHVTWFPEISVSVW